jgi:NADH dehydrogenase
VSWAGPEGAPGQVRLRPAHPDRGQREQAAAHPGHRRLRARVPQHRRGLYLRDHIIRQLELAAVATDPAERAARCTFVVVGAGYTGTEVTAHGQRLTTRLARTLPGLAGQEIRWMLLDPRRGCWPNWIRGCPRPPSGCCGGAVSRC